MKRLSQLINITVNNKLWCPIKIARNGPLLSHLCFANDIILFAKANNDQVKVIKGVLDLFCNCSGKKKNQNKSCIFFSRNVPNQLRMELSSMFGFRPTDNLGKYLGVPLLHEKCKVSNFQYIFDRMNQRLNG